MATITTIGRASLKAAPDTVQISVSLRASEIKCSDAMKKAAGQLEAVRSAMSDAGFDRDTLRTSDFSVSADYESRQDERGVWRQVFIGYAVVNRLSVSIPMDAKRLTDALSAVSGSDTVPEISISFSVSDETALSERLLTEAVKDARRKAETILAAEGSGGVGAVVKAEYGEIEPLMNSMPRMAMAKSAVFDKAAGVPDISPSDIEMSDTVTMTWEIKSI